MVLILPATYAGLALLLATSRPHWGWRRCLLRAGVLWAAFAVSITELLSLGGWISRASLLAAWSLPVLLSIAWFAIRQQSGEVSLPLLRIKPLRADAPFAVAIALVLAITAAVAWYAPPQTWDSLNYHMPRVAHWTWQGSVAHYATGIEVQNSRPPAAEFLALQTYVLAAGDRMVNFVQWSSMALSLLGVSLLTSQLGAGRGGQWAAALFAASLPMGIVQASSTTTDYLVALWVLIAVSELWLVRATGFSLSSLSTLGLAMGLGVATKPTAVPYLAPIGLYFLYLLFSRQGLGAGLPRAAALIVLVLGMNVGHLARNVSTYGSVVDPGQVAVHANQLRNVRGVLSNLSRAAALHAGTPSPHVNKAIALSVQWIHRAIGLDINDPRLTAHGVFKVSPPTTNEDRTGNPLHAYLLLGLGGLAVINGRGRSMVALRYALTPILGFLGLSVLFKWQIFASRYHLPAFVLLAPAAGVWIEALSERWRIAVAGTMILAAGPWLLRIQSRPIVPEAGVSYVGSILNEPRRELYLANGLNLLEPYTEFSERIAGERCDDIGIVLFGNAAEYPLWAYLGAPRSAVSLQWIVAGTPSAKYANSDFRPCAVICEGCTAEVIRGLSLIEERSGFHLYMEADRARRQRQDG